MVEKEKNVVEFAHKVLSFRMNIAKACKAKNLPMPSDEKITEYVYGYGINLNDFMADYIEHEGIFRDPFNDFKAEIINKYEWGDNKPTDEEIRNFLVSNGYDIKGFIRQHSINSNAPLEKDVLVSTIENLEPFQMVQLWNKFIEESALYGEDSYIYDLDNKKDIDSLRRNMTPSQWAKVVALKSRFVQWFSLNDGNIQKVDDDDVKGSIIAYWSDIFPRLMVWSECYEKIGEGTEDEMLYFDYIVRPIFCKYLGYNYDRLRGTIEPIKKD
jgi:hypothetical protein